MTFKLSTEEHQFSPSAASISQWYNVVTDEGNRQALKFSIGDITLPFSVTFFAIWVFSDNLRYYWCWSSIYIQLRSIININLVSPFVGNYIVPLTDWGSRGTELMFLGGKFKGHSLVRDWLCNNTSANSYVGSYQVNVLCVWSRSGLQDISISQCKK
jgi:hypothetical protein